VLAAVSRAMSSVLADVSVGEGSNSTEQFRESFIFARAWTNPRSGVAMAQFLIWIKINWQEREPYGHR
jgi:hypothetical protein